VPVTRQQKLAARNQTSLGQAVLVIENLNRGQYKIKKNDFGLRLSFWRFSSISTMMSANRANSSSPSNRRAEPS